MDDSKWYDHSGACLQELMISVLSVCVFSGKKTTSDRNHCIFLFAGGQPEVVAHGGYSGFFPFSSQPAYDFALDSSIPGTILYCNLHFTKDNDGFCVAQINLQNATNIDEFDPKGAKTYNVNGQEIHGWFGLDYPANIIFENVTCKSRWQLDN